MKSLRYAAKTEKAWWEKLLYFSHLVLITNKLVILSVLNLYLFKDEITNDIHIVADIHTLMLPSINYEQLGMGVFRGLVKGYTEKIQVTRLLLKSLWHGW